MLKRLETLDRRWIFLLMALAVVVPVLYPLGLPVRPSGPVRAAYAYLEDQPAGSYVLLSFDYNPGTRVELQPMAVACLHQCFRNNLKVICMALDPAGQALAREALDEVAPLYHKREGVDYANLGYKAGNEAVVLALGLDLRGTYPVDAQGTPVDQLPVMDGLHSLKDVAVAASWSMGRPGALEHIRLTHSAYGVPLIVGCTAVIAPEYYAYYGSGQLEGLLSGLRAAAEYEVLVGRVGTAARAMDAQSVAHFTIAGLILLSNLIYFARPRRRRKAFA